MKDWGALPTNSILRSIQSTERICSGKATPVILHPVGTLTSNGPPFT